MSIFDKVDDTKFEKDEDRVGGFSPLASDMYAGKIKVAYLGQSESGAKNVTFLIDFNGREFRETIYISSKEGSFTYTKDGKNYPLPGLRTFMDACELYAGKSYKEVGENTEKKLLKIYNVEAGKEVPTECLTFPDLQGVEIKALISDTEEPQYKDPTKMRRVNSISKFLDAETEATCLEKTEEANPIFAKEWLERWKGVVRKGKTSGTAAKGKSGSPKNRKPASAPTDSDDLFE